MRYLAIWLLLASCAAGEDLLLVTDAGYFISVVVNDIPGPWQSVHHVYHMGDPTTPTIPPTVPKPDPISIQVDQWADVADDPATRAEIASAWNQVITDVESGAVTMDNAEKELAAAHGEIINGLDAGKRSAWIIWVEQIGGLIDDQKRQGIYTVDTLKSTHAGLML
jgi:hypothetical protein